MKQSIRHRVERFPDFEQVVHELVETDVASAGLCHDYEEALRQVESLGGEAKAGAASDRHELKVRRAALEQEMLALMHASARV
jgi:hypothetical protein